MNYLNSLGFMSTHLGRETASVTDSAATPRAAKGGSDSIVRPVSTHMAWGNRGEELAICFWTMMPIFGHSSVNFKMPLRRPSMEGPYRNSPWSLKIYPLSHFFLLSGLKAAIRVLGSALHH